MAKNPIKPSSTPAEDMAAELLLKEADEALNQEKLQQLWDEWGSTIVGVALMIIFGTMMGVGWQSWRSDVHSEQTTALVAAQTNPMIAEQSLSKHYKAISELIQAGQIASSTNTPTTSTVLQGMMDDAAKAGLPREWDILAQWGSLRAKADTEQGDKNAIADEMVQLSKKRKNPYAPAILMEAAVLKGTIGKKDEAITLLQQAQSDKITDNVPQLKQQIIDLTHLYQSE